MSEQDILDIHLKVLYDFEYVTKDGRKVIIKEGEKLFLIKKTNSDWWQVIRSSAERPFYVPAAYVEEYSWSRVSSKEITRSSVRRHQEKKLNVPTTCEMKNITKKLPRDKEADSLHNNDMIRSSCSSTGSETSSRNSYKQTVGSLSQKESFSDDHTKILHDKRKSWAVEELVAELSKMRSEKNEITIHESVNNKHHLSEGVINSDQNIMHSSINMTSEDKIMSLSGFPLSIEKDNTGSILQRNQSSKRDSSEENISSTGGVYSIVCPPSSHISKTVGNVTSKLSDSLEKLAQQIQFEPIATSSSRSTPTKLSRSLEEHTAAVEDSNIKMDSMFSRMKNKLGYSSSFKTKKELQQVKKRGVGNSILSTSWEMALSEPQSSINNEEESLAVENERVLRTSGSALESVKGEAKILDGQLKPYHSGSELDVLEQRGEIKKSSIQSWDLLRHKVRSGKLKKIMCVSESESEEYLDESMGQDEGSVSGLSDDNLLLQSSTSKVYSDISDGAISDDLFISTESIRDSDGCRDQSDSQRRRVSLSRGSRVDSHGFRHYSSPPSPSPGHQPVRVLSEGWQEYRTPQGRTFYYNSRTRGKSWKPPRRQHRHNENAEDGSIENLRSDSSSPLAEANGSSGTSYVPVPEGWREAYDDETGQPCYVSDSTGAKWFSSNDSEGRIYFFEENSNESSWTLPEVRVTSCDSPASTKLISKETKMGAKKPTKEEKQLEGDVQLRSDQLGNEPEIKSQYRMAKAHSMAMLESSSGKQASSKSSSFPRNWPQLWDGNMTVLKEGTLNRTKITENGKKLRKNWAPAHVVLTELFLLFFKDAKTFSAMKNAQGESSSAARPEISVDLNGALLEHGEKASSRRNVFLVSTFLGLQVLVQCENGPQAEEWYQAIQKAITDLPSAYDSCPRNKAPKLSPTPYLGSHSPEEFKKSSRIGRSRSVKSVKLSAKEVGSQEDLTVSPDENQTKIKNRLKKFFHRRPTKEALVKKGIYKDEPVFGCHLTDVCKGESPRVPAFVQRCIAAIECKEENMKTDGLYRASGNLSQVQKIRLQVDQNNLSILESEEDVHVLTGALKLFFRELKKPLIPFEYFNKALKASTNQNKKEKLQQFRDIVKALPHPNRDTLEYLLRHLLRVTTYQDSNRMHIPNLAIVFGPTLMWPEAESANMALDLMQQNLVIECFLQEFECIFR